jgi:hypothetical protein
MASNLCGLSLSIPEFLSFPGTLRHVQLFARMYQGTDTPSEEGTCLGWLKKKKRKKKIKSWPICCPAYAFSYNHTTALKTAFISSQRKYNCLEGEARLPKRNECLPCFKQGVGGQRQRLNGQKGGKPSLRNDARKSFRVGRSNTLKEGWKSQCRNMWEEIK